jgi:hypothetical protein
MEPGKARSGGQEGVGPHLGQRQLAHLQRGQALARISQPRSQGAWRRSEDRELPFAQAESSWLNAIEPKWVHGKRKVVEPDGDPLGAYELAERVCGVFDCPHYENLSITEDAA